MRTWSTHPLAGFVIVVGAAALFGTLGPLSRFAYEAGMEPLPFVAWRAIVGVIGTAAFVAWRVRRGGARLADLRRLTPKARLALGVAGVTGFTLNLAMFIAFDRITIALALLGFYTYPAMVAVVAVLLGRERLDPAKLAALTLATVGMILVVASQLDPAAGIRFDAIGFGLALSAAVSQAVFVTISRDGYRDVPADQAMTFVLAVTVVACTAVALLSGAGPALAFPLVNPGVLPLIVVTGLFAAAIPSIAFLAGIRLIGGMRAGILMLFEPVVGVALAAWLLREGVAPIQVVGGGAILVAAVILQRASAVDGQVETLAAPTSAVPLERPLPVEDEALTIRVPGGP